MNLLPHQRTASRQLLKVLHQYNVAYLAGELRTGKTVTSLFTAEEFLIKEHPNFFSFSTVLFITSKKAIPSIEKDAHDIKIGFKLVITNYESCHKFDFVPDFLIIDEAHRVGAYPKSTRTAKQIRIKFSGVPTILMSGTPSPESYSQLFHQFWVTKQGPWKKYVGFYKWAHEHVNIKVIFIGMGRPHNNYSEALPQVMEDFKPYCVTMTQKQAGFDGQIIEQIHTVKTPAYLAAMIEELKRKRYFKDAWITLEADSATRLNSMLHQLSSGTVINNEGKAFTIDDFKIKYIKENFKKRKLAIFYMFQEEGRALREAFKLVTDDPKVFNSNKLSTFVCQTVSGREGINLASADDIIFFNISYSAVSYWQARARSQSFKGGDKHVHWLFSDKGIERAVYEVVVGKKNFTLNHFEAYVRNENSKSDNKVFEKGRLGSASSASSRPGRLARFISFKGGSNALGGSKKGAGNLKRPAKGKN